MSFFPRNKIYIYIYNNTSKNISLVISENIPNIMFLIFKNTSMSYRLMKS